MTSSIFQRAINAWGVLAQLNQMKEECAELIVALSKSERNDKRNSSNSNCRVCNFSSMMCAECETPKKAVITEMVDVAIMLEQMKLIYGEDEFKLEYNRKLKRLEHKLDAWGKRMVSDEEAADIVIANLKSKGYEVKSRDNIIADIKAIRGYKIQGTKEVTDKWGDNH